MYVSNCTFAARRADNKINPQRDQNSIAKVLTSEASQTAPDADIGNYWPTKRRSQIWASPKLALQDSLTLSTKQQWLWMNVVMNLQSASRRNPLLKKILHHLLLPPRSVQYKSALKKALPLSLTTGHGKRKLMTVSQLGWSFEAGRN